MTVAIPEQPQTAALDVQHWSDVLVFASRLADAVSDTEFVPGVLRGRREAVAATIIYGAEVGITPMQALAGIHIVDGRPAPSAELMRAMILRAGHTFVVHEMTGTRARVSGLRRGRPESERVTVDWSLDMARSAGLLGKSNWQRYPRAMLLARATGDLARLLFPDVVKGLGYVAEDESALEPALIEPQRGVGGALVDRYAEPEQPARKPLQRRRRPTGPVGVEDTPLPPHDPQTGELAPIAPDDAGDYGTDDQPPSSTPPRPRYDDEHEQPLPDEYAPVGTGRPLRVMPDPEPERLEPEKADQPPKPIGVRPLKAIQAGLTEQLGTEATREERLMLLGAILRRDVDTSKTLNRDEGYRVLAAFDQFRDGSASWHFTDGGDAIRVLDLREPPDDE